MGKKNLCTGADPTKRVDEDSAAKTTLNAHVPVKKHTDLIVFGGKEYTGHTADCMGLEEPTKPTS